MYYLGNKVWYLKSILISNVFSLHKNCCNGKSQAT